MKDYNMKLKTTKCLNTAVMLVYILGSQNRNFYTAYPGQETLAGSVGGMVLLNATPLRFPLGKIVTKPTDITATSWKVGTTTTANAASKGATRIPIFASGSTAAIAAGPGHPSGHDHN